MIIETTVLPGHKLALYYYPIDTFFFFGILFPGNALWEDAKFGMGPRREEG